jgi:hypothetical protein
MNCLTFDHIASTAPFAALCRLFPFPLLNLVLVHHHWPVNLGQEQQQGVSIIKDQVKIARSSYFERKSSLEG